MSNNLNTEAIIIARINARTAIKVAKINAEANIRIAELNTKNVK